jgi:RNA polymerase sigma factor (sigma-70 family)
METDLEISRGYLEGQRQAHAIVDRWIRFVVYNPYWGLGDRRDDALQETRRRVYESLLYGKFHGLSSLRTYIAQTAKFVCIEMLRSKIRHRADDVDGMDIGDGGQSQEHDLIEQERLRALRDAIAELPERCRELFELIFRDELRYDAIAERLGVAPGTVKSRAARCREMLSQKLRPASTATSAEGKN